MNLKEKELYLRNNKEPFFFTKDVDEAVRLLKEKIIGHLCKDKMVKGGFDLGKVEEIIDEIFGEEEEKNEN